jgi:hypothetical protein
MWAREVRASWLASLAGAIVCPSVAAKSDPYPRHSLGADRSEQEGIP